MKDSWPGRCKEGTSYLLSAPSVGGGGVGEAHEDQKDWGAGSSEQQGLPVGERRCKGCRTRRLAAPGHVHFLWRDQEQSRGGGPL